VTRRLLLLVAGALALWVPAAFAARGLGGGDDALLFSGVAEALCLVPMALALVAVEWSRRQDPGLQVLVVLACSGLRMMLVLGVGLVLTVAAPEFRRPAFWVWLLAVYLVTLALDVALMVGGRPKAPDASPRT
jgi:hypothetical protein